MKMVCKILVLLWVTSYVSSASTLDYSFHSNHYAECIANKLTSGIPVVEEDFRQMLISIPNNPSQNSSVLEYKEDDARSDGSTDSNASIAEEYGELIEDYGRNDLRWDSEKITNTKKFITLTSQKFEEIHPLVFEAALYSILKKIAHL